MGPPCFLNGRGIQFARCSTSPIAMAKGRSSSARSPKSRTAGEVPDRDPLPDAPRRAGRHHARARGGYWLARPPAEISYGEIVRLTRGSLGLLPCASRFAHETCRNCISEDKCRLHRAMLLVRDETARILDGLSLADPVVLDAPDTHELAA